MSFIKTITIPKNKDEMIRLQLKGINLADYYLTIAHRIKDEIVDISQIEDRNIISYSDYRFVQHDDGIGWDIHINIQKLTPLYEYMLINDLTEQDVAYIGADIATALEACHGMDIIHGDVSMENIYVTEDKRFLLDCLGERRLDRITHGEKFGWEADDIYGLGLVMYGLLNDLNGPFENDGLNDFTGSGRARLMSGEPVPPPAHGSRGLSEVICKACAFNSSDRYESMSDFGMAIDSTIRNTDRINPVFAVGGFGRANMEPASAFGSSPEVLMGLANKGTADTINVSEELNDNTIEYVPVKNQDMPEEAAPESVAPEAEEVDEEAPAEHEAEPDTVEAEESLEAEIIDVATSETEGESEAAEQELVASEPVAAEEAGEELTESEATEPEEQDEPDPIEPVAAEAAEPEAAEQNVEEPDKLEPEEQEAQEPDPDPAELENQAILSYLNHQENYGREQIEYKSYTKSYNWNTDDKETMEIGKDYLSEDGETDDIYEYDDEYNKSYDTSEEYESLQEEDLSEEVYQEAAYEENEPRDRYENGDIPSETRHHEPFARIRDEDYVDDYDGYVERRSGNKKVTIAIIIGVIILIGASTVAIYALFFSKEKIDLTQTMGEVVVEGFDSKAKVKPISIDPEKVAQVVEEMGIDNERRIVAINDFYESVRYMPAPANNLSNGDKIVITAKYSEELAREARLDITKFKKNYIVKGLEKEPLITDRTWFRYVETVSDGISVEEICLGPEGAQGDIYISTRYQNRKYIEDTIRKAILKKYAAEEDEDEIGIGHPSRKAELDAMVKSTTDSKLSSLKQITYEGSKYYLYYGEPKRVKGEVKELDDIHIVFERIDTNNKEKITIKYNIEEDKSKINIEDVKGYDISKGTYEKK